MSRSSAPARFAAVVTSVAALVVASAVQSSADPGPDPSRFTVAEAPSQVSQFEVAKSSTGRIAKSDPALLKRIKTHNAIHPPTHDWQRVLDGIDALYDLAQEQAAARGRCSSAPSRPPVLA